MSPIRERKSLQETGRGDPLILNNTPAVVNGHFPLDVRFPHLSILIQRMKMTEQPHRILGVRKSIPDEMGESLRGRESRFACQIESISSVVP